MSPRYVIGIDLGTTHTALAFADAAAPDGGARAEIAPIPQLVAQGTVEARPLLPSFLYLAHESEGPQALPWDADRRFAVGEHARARGVDAPARLVSSAKSWLSHGGVDRRGPTLPVGAPEDVEKISPVEASWRYLEHLGVREGGVGGPEIDPDHVARAHSSTSAGAITFGSWPFTGVGRETWTAFQPRCRSTPL